METLYEQHHVCESVHVTHSLGVLSVHGVTELQQSLKLVVSGERDDFQHRAELTEDLKTKPTLVYNNETNKHKNTNLKNATTQSIVLQQCAIQ